MSTGFYFISLLCSEGLFPAWQFLVFFFWMAVIRSQLYTEVVYKCSLWHCFFFFIKPFFHHETGHLLFTYKRQWTCKSSFHKTWKPPQQAKWLTVMDIHKSLLSFIIIPEISLIPRGRHKSNVHLKEPAGCLALQAQNKYDALFLTEEM